MNTQAHEPTISVIMGVRYRRADLALLERAVNSILNQTFTDFEFLICEYGSTAEARARLEQYAAADCRIQLFGGRAPGTLAHNLNDCLSRAAGRYIARMDDDDFSHSDRFSKQIAFLERHPEIEFTGCNVNLYRGGNIIGQHVFPKYPTVQDFYITQPYIHPTLVFHREALETVGGYSEDKSCVLCEDYDLLLRLYAKGLQGTNLQEVLLDYTIPSTAKGTRNMGHRWNEMVTRWQRFRELKLLPNALPYVVKPLAVGLLPTPLLVKLKERRNTP